MLRLFCREILYQHKTHRILAQLPAEFWTWKVSAIRMHADMQGAILH